MASQREIQMSFLSMIDEPSTVSFNTLESVPQGPFDLGRSLLGELTTTLVRLLLSATIK